MRHKKGEPLAPLLASWQQHALSERVAVGGTLRMYQTGAGKVLYGGGVEWSGVVYLAGKPFRDGALAPDEISGSDVAIVDNSTGGAKTWIKVCVNPYAEAVSYEDAPVFVSGRFPPDTEYYERAKTAGDIHVSRFG